MASTSSSCKVSFSEDVDSASVAKFEETDEDFSSSEESFHEIVTTSEAESGSSDEDAERIEMVFERAYTCSPSLFSRPSLDPVERSSLLLFDKDLIKYDGEMDEGVFGYILSMVLGGGVHIRGAGHVGWGMRGGACATSRMTINAYILCQWMDA